MLPWQFIWLISNYIVQNSLYWQMITVEDLRSVYNDVYSVPPLLKNLLM